MKFFAMFMGYFHRLEKGSGVTKIPIYGSEDEFIEVEDIYKILELVKSATERARTDLPQSESLLNPQGKEKGFGCSPNTSNNPRLA